MERCGRVDLVPMGEKVLIAGPWSRQSVHGCERARYRPANRGRIALANGYASHGEAVRRVRDRTGDVTEVWLGGTRFPPESAIAEGAEARCERR